MSAQATSTTERRRSGGPVPNVPAQQALLLIL